MIPQEMKQETVSKRIGQGAPEPLGGAVTLRYRVTTPLPHVALHGAAVVHSDTTQSTSNAMKSIKVKFNKSKNRQKIRNETYEGIKSIDPEKSSLNDNDSTCRLEDLKRPRFGTDRGILFQSHLYRQVHVGCINFGGRSPVVVTRSRPPGRNVGNNSGGVDEIDADST